MKTYRWIAVLLFIWIVFPLAAFAQSDTIIDETVEKLTLENETIDSLSYLTEYSNLSELKLINCSVVDLSPLASCPRLKTVEIVWDDSYEGTGTYDLTPLAQCEKLTSLKLEGSCIDDLSPIASCTSLTKLTIRSIAAEDYTAIESLTLKHLLLWGAPGEQLSGIFSAIGKRLESTVIGDCTLTEEASDTILSTTKLTSVQFENVDGIDTSAETWAQLKNIGSIRISDCSLTSLDFLSNYVSDVIVKLTDIDLNGTLCSVEFDKYFLQADNVPSEALLSFIGESSCQWLYATITMEDQIISKDVISAFSDISSLLSLTVEAVSSDAWDEETWEGFSDLVQLKIGDTDTVSLSFLSQLNGLKRLVIEYSDITESGAIASCPLDQLSILACNLDDWSFLSGLTELTLLSAVDSNGPIDLSFVTSMQALETLALENAPITDLTPLAGHSLVYLYLYGCQIEDYSPLSTLSSLFTLSCSEDAELPSLSCYILRHQRYVGEAE